MKCGTIALTLFVLSANHGFALQAGRIAGTVTSDAGKPLAGATVTVSEARLGVLTDRDGRFVITGVPSGSHRVSVSLIGYSPANRTVAVEAGQNVALDFQLSTAAIQLAEIVITGYGRQYRRDVTGAIGSVRGAELRQVPTSDPLKAMQGRLAGVDIVNAGYRPGAPMNIRIRGVRSMVATNEPLVVVDGIPITGGIEDFNPANIESIEVLKDASATAVYGARGANGVVLITTRGATEEGTRFTYHTYVGTQRPIHLVDMMTGPEFAEYKREAWRAAGKPTADSLVFTPQELASLRAGTWTDWQRAILRRGLQQNHQLDMSGLTGNTRFSFSGNLFDQRGITINQDFERATGTLSLDHTAGRVRLGITATAARSTNEIGRNDGLWDEALLNNPLGMPYDSNGVLQWRPTPDPLRVNPLSEADGWKRTVTHNRIFASLFSELQLLDGLQWRVHFGPDISDRIDGEFHGPYTTARSGTLAEASRTEEETYGYTLDNLLQFIRQNDNGRLDATLLYSIQEERFERMRAAAQNLPYDQQLWYNLGTGEVRSDVQSDLREWALQSLMGRVHYKLFDKYLVTVTGRFDGSSRLADGNKWAFFPSIGIGWHASEERFIRDLGVFSSLKLRGSYGRTGNTGINPYQTEGSLDRTRYNFGNTGAFGYRPGQIPNPDLEWEKTDQLDVGVDFGVLNNRISGSIDYYRQHTTDLLMLRQLPFTSGFTQTLQNIGATRNNGLEVELSTVLLDGWNGVRWLTSLNASHNHNEIESLYGLRQDDPGNSWFIDQPINISSDPLRRVFYDVRFAGIWQESEAAEAARYGQKPGDIKVADINGDGVINADDRVIVGNTYPKWTAGLSSNVSWRQFNLSLHATARLGYTLFDAFSTRHSGLYGRYNNMAVDYWTPANPTNAAPRPNNGREDPLYASSRAYRSGSHVRVRSVSLGYAVPRNWLSGLGAQAIRIYATAQEPVVFTTYRGYDPESGDYATPPSYRTLLVGASVSF